MKKSSSRLFLIISLLILISLACEAPILSQFIPNTGSSDDTEGSTDNGATSSDSDLDAPHNTDGAEITFIPVRKRTTWQMKRITRQMKMNSLNTR